VQCRTRFFDAPQSVGVDIFVLLNWFARFEIKALSLSLSPTLVDCNLDGPNTNTLCSAPTSTKILNVWFV
jgi:hypothetical protein